MWFLAVLKNGPPSVAQSRSGVNCMEAIEFALALTESFFACRPTAKM